MKGIFKAVIISLGLLAGGCAIGSALWQASDTQSEGPGDRVQPALPEGDRRPSYVPTLQDVQTITAKGFGRAELCLTGSELREQFPDLVFESYQGQGPLVDTEGVTVRDRDGKIAFFALAVVGDGPKLNVLVTDNPDYKTEAGVGPGTTIADATLHYGAARLSYNVNNESREFVAFQYGPEDILFRTGSGKRPEFMNLAKSITKPIAFAKGQKSARFGRSRVIVIESDRSGTVEGCN